ncbi:MAG: hypothetical protein JEY96_05975 [Bacteroidales bacterium]|nr:hypothetical protein [Bacteroidales bacterium]
MQTVVISKKTRKIVRKLFSKRYKSYSQNYYRDRSFYMYNNIESLCNLFVVDKEEIETSKPILLNTNLSFGSKQNQIKKHLGTPSCYIKKTVNSLEFNIMFYKIYMGGFKTKQEVHLYKNELFYFSYVFSYLNAPDKEILQKLLCKKYLGNECELNDKVITDKYGNKIFITENVDFTINYLTGNKKILEEFVAINESTKRIRKNLVEKNQDELLYKL